MTKFEEEAMNEFAKSEYVYTAYDGTFRGETDGTVMEFAKGTTIYTFPWLEFAKNWHSDEEYQELLKENNKLKSQLQQQALPVVPECVAEWYEEHKDDLEHGIYSINVSLNKTAIGELTDVERWFNDVSNEPNETIFIMKRLGYQVEKPQLFYLRDELTGQFLAKDNQFKDKDRYFFWTGADPLMNSIGTAWKLTFTQQEIDSMQTGSYEKIEVAE